MDDAALLFHHTHTHDSNRFERAVRGMAVGSHVTDYVALARALPPGVDAVFVKTDHWRTDPAYFDRLRDRLAGLDATPRAHERHLSFELAGTRAAVVNGVEGSVRADRYHVTVCGLPLDDEGEYRRLSLAALASAADRAAWVAPAHVGLPFHRFPPDLLAEVLDAVAGTAARGALGYATGYVPLYNRLARNEVPFRTPVGESARRFDVPLVPELDLHAAVPPKCSGCGVLDPSVAAALRDGTLPVADLLAADLLAVGGTVGITLRAFLGNYAAFVPGLDADRDWDRIFAASLPDPAALREVDLATDTVTLP